MTLACVCLSECVCVCYLKKFAGQASERCGHICRLPDVQFVSAEDFLADETEQAADRSRSPGALLSG